MVNKRSSSLGSATLATESAMFTSAPYAPSYFVELGKRQSASSSGSKKSKESTGDPRPTTITGIGSSGSSQNQDTSSPTSPQPSGTSPAAGSGPGISDQSTVNAGTVAGGTVGGIAAGLLLGLAVAFFLLRHKYRAREGRQRRAYEARLREAHADVEKHSMSANNMATPNLASGRPTEDVVAKRQLADAKARINALEKERNAASAFGDSLDQHAEDDILNSPAFGLNAFNTKVSQAAMALTVAVSGRGVPGQQALSPTVSGTNALLAINLRSANVDYEGIVRHVINSTLYSRVCAPFCFEASNTAAERPLQVLATSVSEGYNQAMYARWAAMTHATLRKQAVKNDVTQAVAHIQQSLLDSLIEVIVWAGMEADHSTARQVIKKVQSRIADVVPHIARLVTILREEMASATYAVEANSSDSSRSAQAPLTLALGLSRGTTKGESEKSCRRNIVLAPL